MRRLFNVRRDLAGNLPLLPATFPDTMVPVVRLAFDGERELSLIRWGFPPPPNLSNVPVTNVRNLTSPYWRVAQGRMALPRPGDVVLRMDGQPAENPPLVCDR
jgi:putative SOS response-associated peptidase YedK